LLLLPVVFIVFPIVAFFFFVFDPVVRIAYTTISIAVVVVRVVTIILVFLHPSSTIVRRCVLTGRMSLSLLLFMWRMLYLTGRTMIFHRRLMLLALRFHGKWLGLRGMLDGRAPLERILWQQDRVFSAVHVGANKRRCGDEEVVLWRSRLSGRTNRRSGRSVRGLDLIVKSRKRHSRRRLVIGRVVSVS
jgi:hypothetical protein